MTNALAIGLAAAALCIAVISIIAVLGVMREVARLQNEVLARTVATEPAYIGSALPYEFSSALEAFNPNLEHRQIVVLFLSENCSGCKTLLADLAEQSNQKEVSAVARFVLAVVSGDGRAGRNLIQELGIPILLSRDPARVFRAATVNATPSALCISPGFVADEYRKGVDFEWLISRVTRMTDSEMEVEARQV
ncbi:hypothetical protein [Pseudonocardia nigra]|uniref:hypothetical protein n=1 Tax=Pseudonocardia nigra TaxID=1921578 RepID=UPI001C5E326E|nr:hypothetical protein [Pseudonocardia nigra]